VSLPLRVAVLGATGMIGKPVTNELIEAGYDVTVIARNVVKARDALPRAAKVLYGDVADASGLASVMSGIDVVVLCLAVDAKHEGPNDFHPELDGLRNVLDAAQAGGVRRVCYLSSLLQEHPSDWWVMRIKRAALAEVRQAGLPHSIFYASNFMENLVFRNLRGNTLSLIGKPRHKNWWIAAADFGKQLAAHLRALPARSSEFVVQGPEAADYYEAAQRFAQASSRPGLKVGFAPVPVLSLLGLAVKELSYAVNISKVINDYPETFRAASTWQELGKPATTIDAYARAIRL
jgi:uncharacterized protein YbjT (DUF2867 family)